MRKHIRKFFVDLEWFFLRILFKIRGIKYAIRYLHSPNTKFTIPILQLYGAKIGSRTTIKQRLYLDNVFQDENSRGDMGYLKIGQNCYIGDGVYIDLANNVSLENNSILSGKVSIVTHADCNRSKILNKKFPRRCEPVNIGEGAWIGFGVTILTGVSVGENSVVAAHSVVNADVEPNSLYGGIPARKIKSLL